MLAYDNAFEATAAGMGKGMEGILMGTPFMATILDGMLMGIIICQMTHWFPNSKYEARHVRALICCAVLGAIGGTIYSWVHWMDAFVYHFGEYARFFSIDAMGWYGFLDGLIVIPVQLVFIERAVRINGNSIIVAILTGTLTAATGALGVTWLAVSRGRAVWDLPQSAVMVSVFWPAICTLTHVTITATILWGLYHSRTDSRSANKLITRLMSVSIESQLPSTLVAVGLLSIIAADPRSPFIPFIAIVHPKVFLVGMLAMVNLRHEWRNSGKTPSQYDTRNTQSRLSAPGLSSRGTTQENSELGTPHFGSPKSSDRPPYASSGRIAQGIEDECGMVMEMDVKEKTASRDSFNPFYN